MDGMAAPLHVEIWSDVVCPWCYVGKRRFEAALEAFPTGTTSRSCGAPSSSTRRRRPCATCPADEHLAAKYGMTRRGRARA